MMKTYGYILSCRFLISTLGMEELSVSRFGELEEREGRQTDRPRDYDWYDNACQVLTKKMD